MNPTLRELKNDEIVKHGDLWISSDLPISKIQDPDEVLMFTGVFADCDEVGCEYGKLRQRYSDGWHCWRTIMPITEHDPNNTDPDNPRNIDMTL